MGGKKWGDETDDAKDGCLICEVIEKEEMGLFNEVNEQPKTLREKVKSELDFDEVIKKCNLKRVRGI